MLFTIFIWILALLIYLSGPKNKANRWCAINAVVCSMGAFKEFYYFDMVPFLQKQLGERILPETYTAVYSVMTAIVYHLALPTGLLFIFHFCGFDKRYSRPYRWLRYGIFLPSLMLLFVYSPLKMTWYQHNDRIFWYAFSLYNVGYGVFYTFLMILGILREANVQARKQKRLIAILLLPAIWFCLTTIFIIHSLGIKELFKLWKGNTLILAGAILFYIVMAFREGIMGLRLRSENYRWNSDMYLINKNAQFTGHLIKNETAKIDWCLENLKTKCLDEGMPLPGELDIIARSVAHMQNFNQKVCLYSGDILLNEHQWNLKEVLTQAVELNKNFLSDTVTIQLECREDILIYCDRAHLVEVLNNLIQNAYDAFSGQGSITIRCYEERKKAGFCIAVHDNGPGMGKETLERLFEPYFTTKKTDKNFGLGLSYCRNVLKKHSGSITVKSPPGEGTTFILSIPIKRITGIVKTGNNLRSETLCEKEGAM